ncbi:MAG: phosphoribosyl-AMP cyclohydrolase [Rhodospirillaceae bacterium]
MTAIPNIAALLDAVLFNADGLVPAIAQQEGSGEVLMMAWMNRDALTETLSTGRVCYWSRSRGALWRKGESSGQVQVLKQLLIDCDGDTLLLIVDQAGVACHTGRRSCFYRTPGPDGLETVLPVVTEPEKLYGKAVR